MRCFFFFFPPLGISLCNLCSFGSILGGRLYYYCQCVLSKDEQSNVSGGSSLAAPLLSMQNYLHAGHDALLWWLLS